jgi:RES domain-containing protein
MKVWRLTQGRHAPGLDGEGARLWGGRWNSPGVAMVYASASLSLSLCEVLVHLLPSLGRPGGMPRLVAVCLDLPDGAVIPGLQDPDLPQADTRAAGDAWAQAGKSLAISVPSRVVPQEANILLNPAHPGMARVRVVSQDPFAVDPRLYAAASTAP